MSACVHCAGLFVAIISEGHVYVVESGDTVSLECNFHADQYDLFQYPVLWRKKQCVEDSQVNVMGTLMEPFSQHDRFEVTFDAFDSRYRLMLHIHGRLSPSLRSLHDCTAAQCIALLRGHRAGNGSMGLGSDGSRKSDGSHGSWVTRC